MWWQYLERKLPRPDYRTAGGIALYTIEQVEAIVFTVRERRAGLHPCHGYHKIIIKRWDGFDRPSDTPKTNRSKTDGKKS